jgi:hypothetical protein
MHQQQCKAFFRHVLATTSRTKTEPNRVGWKTRSTGYCFVSGSDVHIEVFISLKLHWVIPENIHISTTEEI